MRSIVVPAGCVSPLVGAGFSRRGVRKDASRPATVGRFNFILPLVRGRAAAGGRGSLNTPVPWRLCAAQQARFIQTFVHVHAALEAVENRSVTDRAEVFRNRPEWFFGGHPLYRIKSRETHGA
jgi:hypothetical protein